MVSHQHLFIILCILKMAPYPILAAPASSNRVDHHHQDHKLLEEIFGKGLILYGELPKELSGSADFAYDGPIYGETSPPAFHPVVSNSILIGDRTSRRQHRDDSESDIVFPDDPRLNIHNRHKPKPQPIESPQNPSHLNQQHPFLASVTTPSHSPQPTKGTFLWHPEQNKWVWVYNVGGPSSQQQSKERPASNFEQYPPERPNPCQAHCLRTTVTQEYNPLCGSDGVTYRNPSRLKCALLCGRNVNAQPGKTCGLHAPVI